MTCLDETQTAADKELRKNEKYKTQVEEENVGSNEQMISFFSYCTCSERKQMSSREAIPNLQITPKQNGKMFALYL